MKLEDVRIGMRVTIFSDRRGTRGEEGVIYSGPVAQNNGFYVVVALDNSSVISGMWIEEIEPIDAIDLLARVAP